MSGNIRKVVKLQIAFVVHATNGLCPICKKVEEEILKSYHHIYKSIYNLNHQMRFKSCDSFLNYIGSYNYFILHRVVRADYHLVESKIEEVELKEMH